MAKFLSNLGYGKIASMWILIEPPVVADFKSQIMKTYLIFHPFSMVDFDVVLSG